MIKKNVVNLITLSVFCVTTKIIDRQQSNLPIQTGDGHAPEGYNNQGGG